ncbi:ankyrin repeat protein [Colletotrichum plurivorum]|uniref:Ankyrin repeat protein n=1 Tax=Colletotrichum plurivorum TaxID=2175906 RepID=A0A8H6KGQ2_9PEZI|nr:ankyrin repeat protein [Colletotrichum plurivorum]
MHSSVGDEEAKEKAEERRKHFTYSATTWVEPQRREVYQWLHHTDPSPIHYEERRIREPGTCDWVTVLPEWQSFLIGRERCLWIHGIPGAGKTVLASHLIREIEKNCMYTPRSEHRCFSVYYYCDFSRQQSEAAPFLKWVLTRLCREADSVPDHLFKLFDHGAEPSLSDLLESLDYALTPFDVVYLTIDAVDESDNRTDLLKVLRELATNSKFAKIRLLVTIREYLDIEETMGAISKKISMRNTHVDNDIRRYVLSRLGKAPFVQAWPEDLRQDTVGAFEEIAYEMFRWVSCQIDELRRVKGNSTAASEQFGILLKPLNEQYDRIFQQISIEDLPIVDAVLERFRCSHNDSGYFEAIELNALVEAVSDELAIGSLSARDLRVDAERIREACGCLISIFRDKSREPRDAEYVAVAHHTLFKYRDSKEIWTPASSTT